MGSPMALSHFTLSDIERSKSRSPKFGSLISHKGGAYLGPMLLVVNHLWGVQWHLHIHPSVTLKGHIQGQSDFK